MKNGNTITQHIIANQPRVTTVDSPQTISFRNIKRKCREKTAAQAHIQRLSPPVDEVLTENKKDKKQAKRSLKNVNQKAKTGKKSEKLT